MSSTFTHVLPLALGAAISPTILTIGIIILAGQHGRARMTIFAVVNIVLMTAIAVIGLKVFAHAVNSNSKDSVSAASAAVDIVLGVVLILLGIRTWYHGESEKTDKPKDTDSALHPVRYVLLAAAFTLTNFTTLILYGPALKTIALAKLPSGDEILITAVLIVIVTITAWMPLLASVIAPKPAGRVLDAVNTFTTVHRRAISIAVLLVFGVYLLVKGLTAG